MNEIKAIQTAYKGYHFRSRLEARWAVFFDALGLKWEYEPEGFDLPIVGKYLPDFRITVVDIGEVYVEVKPPGTTEADWRKAKCLSLSADKNVLLLAGVPGPIRHTLCPSAATGEWVIKEKHLFYGYRSGRCEVPVSFTRCGFLYGQVVNGCVVDEALSPHYLTAIVAARSARFEHGQSGATL